MSSKMVMQGEHEKEMERGSMKKNWKGGAWENKQSKAFQDCATAKKIGAARRTQRGAARKTTTRRKWCLFSCCELKWKDRCTRETEGKRSE